MNNGTALLRNNSKLARTRIRVSSRRQPGIAAAAVTAGAVATAFLALAILFTGSAQAAPDDSAVRQAARDAVISEQQAPVLPLAASATLLVPQAGQAAGATSSVPQSEQIINPASPVPLVTSQGMVTRGNADLAKHFAQKELVKRQQALQDLVDRQNDDVRILAAGIDAFTITSLTINGQQATVSATGVAWRDIAQVQDGNLVVAHPRSSMIFSLTLQKIGGTWLVTDQTMKYAPGSQP